MSKQVNIKELLIKDNFNIGDTVEIEATNCNIIMCGKIDYIDEYSLRIERIYSFSTLNFNEIIRIEKLYIK